MIRARIFLNNKASGTWSTDGRFNNHDLVTSLPNLRFYGAECIDEEGEESVQVHAGDRICDCYYFAGDNMARRVLAKRRGLLYLVQSEKSTYDSDFTNL